MLAAHDFASARFSYRRDSKCLGADVLRRVAVCCALLRGHRLVQNSDVEAAIWKSRELNNEIDWHTMAGNNQIKDVERDLFILI
jgi:hypothetical protein